MSKRTKLIHVFISVLMIAVTAFGDVAYAAVSLIGSPTASSNVTSPFGYRASTNSNHLAIDIGASSSGVAGDALSSTISGRVVESRYQTNSAGTGGWGNTVVVESTSGNYRVRYSHMDQPGLSTGTVVTPGQQVGVMGGTGRSGGYPVHLDYAVYVQNPDTGQFQAIDPQAAAGMDLDDPDVRRSLIADAQGKIDGELRAEGDPMGDAGYTVDSTDSDQCLKGCDCGILEANKVIVDALNEVNAEIIKANIQQPTPVEMMSCLDQQLELISASGGIHANPGGDISASMNPFAKVPLIGDISKFLSGVSAQVNSLTNVINTSFSNIASSFTGSLSGLTGGAAPTTSCGVTEQTWLINQCIQMPKIPSLDDIVGGKLAELSGGLAALVDPDRYLQQVCSKANSALQGFFGDLNKPFDKMTDQVTKPILDGIP